MRCRPAGSARGSRDGFACARARNPTQPNGDTATAIRSRRGLSAETTTPQRLASYTCATSVGVPILARNLHGFIWLISFQYNSALQAEVVLGYPFFLREFFFLAILPTVANLPLSRTDPSISIVAVSRS
jgi:hypothetical protein